MIAFKHILVPTDFSEPSEHALALAIEIARAFHARLTLLHVWNLPSMAYAAALAWPIEDTEEAARAALEELHRRTSRLFAETSAILKFGSDWEQIIEVANESSVDLIVMGTQGRRGLPRLILGSVAGKVVRLSPVPVLTVSAVERRERERAIDQ